MKVSLLLACLFLMCGLFPSLSHAKYVQTCNAKYYTEDGWSKYYTVEVSFYGGQELNTATSTWDFEPYDTYAVIFWGKDQATVIKVKDYTGCGSEANKRCITSALGNLKGKDQQNRIWEICVSNYCM